MLDWQVNEEEQPLASLPEEGPKEKRVRRWRVWGGLLLVLVVAGLLLFRWRLSERTELMKADLKAFIRHEEQQRVFGLAEQADKLMQSNAPEQWREGYHSTFVAEADEVQPVKLEIEEIEFEDTTAYVTMRLDGVSQVRFYRLMGQEWRRAPLFAAFWGEEKQIELADEDITIVYPAREEAFAQKLAADLPLLLQQWPWPAKKIPTRIRIKPSEFMVANFFSSTSGPTQQITLNSPKLVVPEYAEVYGEAAVRLALANRLLEEVNLDYETQQSLLPGAVTFLGALRNTIILRWALPNEAIPRQIWRDKVTGLWKSPFLGQWLINREDVLLTRTWEPRLSEATALLMADYLYDQIEPEEVRHVAKRVLTAPSWDRIFYPYTRRYTISLEEEMILGKPVKMTAHNIHALPLSVTRLDMDPESGVLEAEITGQGRPLSILTADSILIDAEGEMSDGRCAMLHQEVTIKEGDWLEVGQRFQARQLVISDPKPAILPEETALAPPDTLAYLAESRDGPGHRRGFETFFALSEDGGITDLMTLPPEISFTSYMQRQNPWPSRFLLGLSVPNCEQAWLLMYDSQQGIVGHWLFDSGIPFGFVWRPVSSDLVLLDQSEETGIASQTISFFSAQPNEPLRLLGEVKNSPPPPILGMLASDVVTLNKDWTALKLINLKLGQSMKSIPLVPGRNRIFGLSADGEHLLYTSQRENTEGQSFYVLDLERGQNRFLFETSQEQFLASSSGQVFTDRVLLLSHPVTDGQLIATELLLVDLNTPGQPKVVTEISEGQHVTSALACADDRVLMTIYDGKQSELRMWQADGSMKSLLNSDRELMLVSCR